MMVIYMWEFPDNWGRLMRMDDIPPLHSPRRYQPREEDHPWFEHHDRLPEAPAEGLTDKPLLRS